MVNKSKLTQRRFWKKWRDSGAVSTGHMFFIVPGSAGYGARVFVPAEAHSDGSWLDAELSSISKWRGADKVWQSRDKREFSGYELIDGMTSYAIASCRATGLVQAQPKLVLSKW